MILTKCIRMRSEKDADDLHLAFASVNLTLGEFELALNLKTRNDERELLW